MPDSGPLKDALALAGLGWPVFPVRLAPKGKKVEKRPLLRAWQKDASDDEGAIRAMPWAEANAVGVALPEGVAAVDVDEVSVFEEAGLDVPETHGQKTQSGGYHRLYRTDGRTVRQTVKEVPGADTRVGGKGYLVAWERWSFQPGDLSDAPEWMYAEKEGASAPIADDSEPMATRGQLIAFAGSMRAGGMTGAEVYAILEHRLGTGGIASSDPAWPWALSDMRTIAQEAQKWAAGRPLEPPTVRMTDKAGNRAPIARPGTPGAAPRAPDRHGSAPARHPKEAEVRLWGAQELLDADLPELRWVIPGLLPEGTTVLAARPKIGKSWLAYQIAISVALGSTVLGQRASRGASLYLALEDGERRGQSRLKDILRQQGVRAVPEGLEVAFEWPRMGEGCEELITAWLDRHPDAVTVWVDTLARIRPKSTGRRNAYEVDYEDMGALQSLVVSRGVGLGIVHHDRKAETDDFLESVSGTHGITGAADTIMVLKRSRNSSDATLDVTGRDIEERRLGLAKEGPIWVLSGKDPDATNLQNDVLGALAELGGEARLADIVDALAGRHVTAGQADYENGKKAVYGAFEDELIIRVDRGVFALKERLPSVNLRPHARSASQSSHPIQGDSQEGTPDSQEWENGKNGKMGHAREPAHAQGGAPSKGGRRIVR